MPNDTASSTHRDRLGGADLDALLDRISAAYDLGAWQTAEVIPFGYEDCNVKFTSLQHRLAAKILPASRPPGFAGRLAGILRHAIACGVSHPPLRSAVGAENWYYDPPTGTSVIVMDFVEGQTFLQAQTAPNTGQLAEIVRQIACLHTTAHRPPLLADPWAMQNMSSLLAAADVHLPAALRPFLHTLLARLADVDFPALPHRLIHGDLTKGNLISTADNQIAIIDFGVANYLPRVQELAVAAANLMHDGNTALLDRCEHVREAYTRHADLTDEEHRLLPTFTAAAASMELLGALYEKTVRGNATAENEYILRLGLDGVTSAATTRKL